MNTSLGAMMAPSCCFWQIENYMKNLSRQELLQRIWIDPTRCGGGVD